MNKTYCQRGFTLLETMITVLLFGLVMAGIVEVFIMCNKFWHVTSLSMETEQMANLAVSRIINGYGTNMGIRGAASMELQTNVYGHPIPFLSSYKYWETGESPPAAADTAHYAHMGCAFGSDGSWRLIFSNSFDGVHCIDYNIRMRNILFCPDTNQTSAARQNRTLICNYVSAASVIPNADGSAEIRFTVEKRDGMFLASNQASLFITERN
ncbi:MAG: prepilin-type N-terminal cleavage/methylation domain-containing protein [Kiritimatiellae bacterium]|nr:prepilin-type N-terminal cleavage/methylation domain-containing protein [Kiritimatiellia bacterium]